MDSGFPFSRFLSAHPLPHCSKPYCKHCPRRFSFFDNLRTCCPIPDLHPSGIGLSDPVNSLFNKNIEFNYLPLLNYFLYGFRFDFKNINGSDLRFGMWKYPHLFFHPTFVIPPFFYPILFYPHFFYPHFFIPTFFTPIFLAPFFLPSLFLTPLFFTPIFFHPHFFFYPHFFLPPLFFNPTFFYPHFFLPPILKKLTK